MTRVKWRVLRLWGVRLASLALAVAVFLIIVPRAWDHGQLMTGWGLPHRSGAPLAIVAHRGDLSRYPENTLEAIAAAAEAGADGIEFDVHQSADGTWWVIHDPVVDRTTNGTGAVHNLDDVTMGDLVVNGGLGYDPDRHQHIRVPTLSDVLAELAEYRGVIYVDIQHAVTADAAEVASLVADRRAHVLCRSQADARAVKETAPWVGTLLRIGEGEPMEFVDGWLAEAVREATPAVVERSHLPVTTFLDEHRHGDDERPALRRAWAIGVKAFLTKDLHSVLAWRDALWRAS